LDPARMDWLKGFSDLAAVEQKSLLGRYRLMDVLLKKLNEMKAAIQTSLAASSPLEQYKEAEQYLVDKWEDELAAAVEAEYRRQRSELLGTLQWWLRDVWIATMHGAGPAQNSISAGSNSKTRAEPGLCASSATTESLIRFPNLEGTTRVAQRISLGEAMENLRIMEQLQRWLHTNVQEALALEVGLLKLRL
jgi:hypothetical protein